MHVEARVFCQSRWHGRVLVRGAVIGDQMQRLARGRLAVDLPPELQPFGSGVALLTLADDLPVKHIKGREQRGRAFRLNETLDRRGRTQVRLAEGWRATQVRLRAQSVAEAATSITFDCTPYALISVLIERASPDCGVVRACYPPYKRTVLMARR